MKRRSGGAGRDAFYTAPKAARLVWKAALAHCRAHGFSYGDITWVEPSAGAGVYLDTAPAGLKTMLEFDIEPANPRIQRQDFLTWRPPSTIGTWAVIGNPPFGRSGSDAARFINRALSLGAEFCCLILPSALERKTAQRAVKAEFGVASSVEFDTEDAFTRIDGAEYTPPGVRIMVWVKGGKRDGGIAPAVITPGTLGALVADKRLAIEPVKSDAKSSEYTAVGIPLVQTSTLNGNEITQARHHVGSEVYARLGPKQDIQRGDILMVKSGDKRVGDVAVVETPCIVAQGYFFKLRSLDDGIDPWWLMRRLDRMKGELLALREKQMIYHVLPLENLLGVRIEMPPRAEQAEVRRKVCDYFSRRRAIGREWETL